MAEGQVVHQARDEMASDIIQKVECPLRQTMNTPLEEWIIVTLADLQTSQGEKIIQ
jgi:hypothetical protein